MTLNAATVALLAGLAFAGPANALTVFAAEVDTPPPADQQVVLDFDGALTSGFTLSLAGAASVFSGALGLIEGIAAPPPGTTSNYLSLQQGGSAVLITPEISRLSVYIGSPDNFNSIRFLGVNGFDVMLTGAELAGGAFNGDQSVGRRMTYDFGGERVTQVIFASSSNSFEFDNVAVGIVPEPGVWALMIAGFGMVGAALRSRTRKIFA